MEIDNGMNKTDNQQYMLAGEAAVVHTPGVKRGHKCCGGCCDVRKFYDNCIIMK